MTIERRPNATADKTAPSQAPVPVTPPAVPGQGPKVPGPPGAPGTERFRLLAYVKQESMVRVDKRPDETVLTWPHLLRPEFLMACLITAMLLVMSFFVQAPLESEANVNVTPHVAKAPWYFLGLQELLAYFNPTVAGFFIPMPFYFVALALIAYVDRSPYRAARDRKLAWILFLSIMFFGIGVTIIGAFFRGPGWNWVWPWDGLFFTL
jgi:quinol---cytochrome c reductase cytochrome c subunit, bacillus type